MTITEFNNKMNLDGWVRVKKAYSPALMDDIKKDMEDLDSIYKPIQERAGVGNESKNAYHHTLLACKSMFKLLSPNPVALYLEEYFKGKYILNTLGASNVLPNSNIYTQNVHRDVRSHTGAFRLAINTLVMLDDSTEENGATWMLSGSHKTPNQPDDEYFFDKAVRACGNSGDVLLFDGNIWHCAGINNSDKPRRIITPIYSKPFMKQQLDYPRALGASFQNHITDELKQVLGYNALTPTSLKEFYQPIDKRFYKADQG